MQNKFETQDRVELQSNWKLMFLPFVGELIFTTIILIFLLPMIISKFIPLEGAGVRGDMPLFMGLFLLGMILAWAWFFMKYYPKKWNTKVMLDFQNKLIDYKGKNNEMKMSFSEIESITYEPLTSMFNTSYLFYFKKTNTESSRKTPLLVLKDQNESNDLYFAFKNRCGIKMFQISK